MPDETLEAGEAPRGKRAKADLAGSVLNLKDLELRLDALLRADELRAGSASRTPTLLDRRCHLYAQNEEDGIIFALLEAAGWASRQFVDVGCGHNGGNSGLLAAELLFGGLMVDGDPGLVEACARRYARSDVSVRCAFVTRENVDELVSDAGLAGDIAFLSIDIDGNDIWLWQALTAVSPRVVCIEYNSRFGPDASVAVPYDPEFVRRSSSVPRAARGRYFGCSLRALADVGRRKGYRLVTVEPRGANAFFVRDDVAPEVPEVAVGEAFRMLDKNRRRHGVEVDGVTLAQQLGLALVDLGPA
jgi:hypothetical protein